MNVRWEHFVNSFDSRHLATSSLDGTSSSSGGKHSLYVREFASVVSIFQDRTDALIDMDTETRRLVEQLATCPYTSEAFEEVLGTIQRTIDKLNLEGYANLDEWVRELDAKIEEVLLVRLRAVVDKWCEEFGKEGEDKGNKEGPVAAARKKAAATAKEAQVCLCKLVPSSLFAD